MLVKGMDVALVAEMTGLSPDEVASVDAGGEEFTGIHADQ
jgi:hypothetical protein